MAGNSSSKVVRTTPARVREFFLLGRHSLTLVNLLFTAVLGPWLARIASSLARHWQCRTGVSSSSDSFSPLGGAHPWTKRRKRTTLD